MRSQEVTTDLPFSFQPLFSIYIMVYLEQSVGEDVPVLPDLSVVDQGESQGHGYIAPQEPPGLARACSPAAHKHVLAVAQHGRVPLTKEMKRRGEVEKNKTTDDNTEG